MAVNGVNYVPMTPLTLLERAAQVFPERTATVYQGRRVNYREFHGRVRRLASALLAAGLKPEGRVAVLAPNVPMVLEAHYGVPLAGGVLVAINTRLNGREIAYILAHSGADSLIVDRGLLGVVLPVLGELPSLRRVIVAEDEEAGPDDGRRPEGALDYEAFLAGGSPEPLEIPVTDENQLISINYTSGTTGQPKGVMFTHRGAYLNALNDCMQNGLNQNSVYLWTLPMFHCNGWCFSWAVPGVGAASICLRAVEPNLVRELIQSEGVTHFCGAPVVLNMLASLPDAERFRFEKRVRAPTGGAPPSPTLLAAMERMNVEAVHLYGLTETYGPVLVCEVQDEWLRLNPEDYGREVARQGVPHPIAGEVRVLDAQHRPVPPDAATMGEVCVRGNLVMKGYYRDEEATAEAFREGWFHTGDLGVLHPDGYIEVRDRAKDIIISGGENISTIEVENTLAAHPGVQEAAVVSRPDEKWGEVPVAFVTPREGRELDAGEVIGFCRERLAHFKCPKEVFFEELPHTSTGKVQKYALRERMWEEGGKEGGGEGYGAGGSAAPSAAPSRVKGN